MKLLAIETATEACSAAIYIDGEIFERYELAPRKHNELILPMCEQVLSEAGVALTQLDALAFGCGPGAFTGLRIAASVTQAIALAHELPVACVSTLANLAQQAPIKENQSVLTTIDARMEEVYWAIYKKNPEGDVELLNEEKVELPGNLYVNQTIDYGLGTGWGSYNDELNLKVKLASTAIDGHALPRASITATLGSRKYLKGDVVEAMKALPVYLRNQVVHQKA